MRFADALLSLFLGVVLGTALWVSFGVLDQLEIDGVMRRVALLPSWPLWIGLVSTASLVLAGLQHLLATRVAPEPRAHVRFWALPLVGLVVLPVPYLPWVADRWPLWQIPAGPFRWLVWAAVVAQLGWVAWRYGWIRLPGFARLSIRHATVLVWTVVCLASGWSAWRLTSTPQFPTGDEPHYLIIAQSLWRDGDLKIENNHTRGDYREYFGGTLPPHYITRGVDGEIYSIHPIGMPVIIAPIYAAGGYPLVVFAFVLMAATATTLFWRWTARWVTDAGAAIFGWAALITSAPFLLNTPTIYPEIPAALAVALAFTLGGCADTRAWRAWAAGLAVAALPWLSTKYAPMSAALALILVARAWLVWTPWPALSPAPVAGRLTAAVLIPYALSLAGWFAFFQAYWGAPWPSGPYGALTQTTPLNLLFGAPGLLFDQEYGLLPYAPVLVLAVPGLCRMLRRGGEERRLAVETLLVFGALFATVGAFRIWWGGSAVVGRPVVSGLLLLMVPIAVQFAAAPTGSARRAAQHLLLCFGAAITLALVVVQDGVLLGNQRDGTSTLLTWLSPRWDLWRGVPTFVRGDTDIPAAWLQTVPWVAFAIGAGVWLKHVRVRSPGPAGLAALGALAVGLLLGVTATGMLPDPVARPRPDLTARTALAALDGFDTTRRPLVAVYDPFRIVRPEALMDRLILRAEAGRYSGTPQLPLLHNARFALPAGRYRVVIGWSDDVSPTPVGGMGLQVGRSGPPLREWAVAPETSGVWEGELSLPVDAMFVGFRGSPELERSIASIEIHAAAVVNQSERPSTPDVLGAAAFGNVSVFFHDGATHGEVNGFWALGSRQTVITLASAAPRSRLRLRVHSGEIQNRVTFSSEGWRHTADLEPGEAVEIEVPPSAQTVREMVITTERTFVPSATNPASDDHRRLGAWIGFDANQ